MKKMILSSRQVGIVSVELAAALEKLADVEGQLMKCDVSMPEGGGLAEWVQALIVDRNQCKGHLMALLKALAGDSADRIVDDYRVPGVTMDDVADVLKNNVIGRG